MAGTLFVVATPIGNLDDITLRALKILRDVSVIAAEDTRRTAHLLARHAIATPTTSLHEHNEVKKSASLIARLERGDHVALVSDAGTPTVSDPGGRLIREAVAAGIRVEPVPGASAVLAALSVAGLDTDLFTFLGFPPTGSKARKLWFERLRLLSGAVVFFEAPHRIRVTLTDLLEMLGDRHVVIARELTKIHEELVRGPISWVLERLPQPRGEFTVVLELGLMPETKGILFGETPDKIPASRRESISALARTLGLSANDVYTALETLKK
jgi:16S rRNA (cytidine1402-2'-O)-methyltransferase